MDRGVAERDWRRCRLVGWGKELSDAELWWLSGWATKREDLVCLVLSLHRRPLTRRQISDTLGLSETTVNLSLKNLLEIGLISRRLAHNRIPRQGRVPHEYFFARN